MKTKPDGTHNEHRSILLLESAGYACTRVAASLGIFDVIGTGPTDVVLVPCKTRDWPGSVEMEAIRNFQCPPSCKKIIHLGGYPRRAGSTQACRQQITASAVKPETRIATVKLLSPS